jgi:hypothetical protein
LPQKAQQPPPPPNPPLRLLVDQALHLLSRQIYVMNMYGLRRKLIVPKRRLIFPLGQFILFRRTRKFPKFKQERR